jgi:chorismate synthase
MLRYLTAGESHGECLTTIVDGLPAGLKVDEAFINAQLACRQSGYGRSERQKIETDRIHFTAGVRHGETISGPVSFTIKNADFSIADKPAITRPRPGHADLAGLVKYDRTDARDVLERSSARGTSSQVGAGALAQLLLGEFGVRIVSFVINIGGISAAGTSAKADVEGKFLGEIEAAKASSRINCADPMMEAEMIELINRATEQKDTLGGIFELVAVGLPPGLGSYAQHDRRLDGRLAQALMAIQAIKGVEIGDGFMLGMIPGSAAHDEIFRDPKREGFKYFRKTNHAGGLEGGMTNGMPLVMRAVMKPISTLRQPLKSVDLATGKVAEAAYERSDVTAVPAACVVAEAAVALVLADAFLEKFGADSLADIRAAHAAYIARISKL